MHLLQEHTRPLTFLLFYVPIVLGNYLLTHSMERANEISSGKTRYSRARVYRNLLITLFAWNISSLVLFIFFSEIHWLEKLFMGAISFTNLQHNSTCLKVTKRIIGAGVLVNLVKSSDNTTFESVLRDGHLDPNGSNQNGTPALFIAVAKNDYDKARLLIDYGANVNLVHTERGVTALQTAVMFGNAEIVSLLLQRGADCPCPHFW